MLFSSLGHGRITDVQRASLAVRPSPGLSVPLLGVLVPAPGGALSTGADRLSKKPTRVSCVPETHHGGEGSGELG